MTSLGKSCGSSLVLSACALLLAAAPGWAGAAKELKLDKDTPARVESKLTNDDTLIDGKRFKLFKVRLEKGKTYQLDLGSKDIDPYLYLKSADGAKTLAEDDDGGGGLDSRILYTPEETATYQVGATALTAGQMGDFTLTISAKGAVAKAGGQELKLKDGKAQVQGQLANGDPVEQGKSCKVFTCKFAQGKSYRLDLDSTDFDAYLMLLGPTGRVVAQDDDGGGNLNSRILWNAEPGGTYRILATSLGGKDVGNFTLTVTEGGAAKVAKAEEIELKDGKAEIQGQLTTENPRFENKYAKPYRIKLEAGKSYRIDLVSTDFDSFLYLLGPKGEILARDDDGGGDLNARIVYDVKTTGTYQIQAASLGAPANGNFTLSVAVPTKAERAQAQLDAKIRDIARGTPAEQKQTLQEVRQSFDERRAKLSRKELVLAMQLTRALEVANPPLAIEAYSDFGKLFAHSGQPQLEEYGRRMEGAGRRLGLTGKEMTLTGTTTDGRAFDLKKMRGKVVLVDFWATWCGPCVGEIPNMKSAYEKYHKRGFEIIGVSLDRDREALTKFTDEKELPWKSIYDQDAPKGKGLADYYGVMAIPLPILLDRDGRVVSMSARGPELERLLEELLAEKK
jgi:thiol-disulfide isomerase/thioredoxin